MLCLDEFVMIHASYLSHISEDVILAPKSKLNDGVIWLLIVRNGISRAAFLQVNLYELYAILLQINNAMIKTLNKTTIVIV